MCCGPRERATASRNNVDEIPESLYHLGTTLRTEFDKVIQGDDRTDDLD
jgi:hypothetical protein